MENTAPIIFYTKSFQKKRIILPLLQQFQQLKSRQSVLWRATFKDKVKDKIILHSISKVEDKLINIHMNQHKTPQTPNNLKIPHLDRYKINFFKKKRIAFLLTKQQLPINS